MGNVYMLRCGKSHFGFRRYNKSYVIGLPNKRVALRIRNGISNVSNAKLACDREWCAIDGKGARVSEEEPTVSIGELVIQKKALCYSASPEIEAHDIEDFMLYPTKRNIGIVYGLVLLAENEREFRFESLIIDPVFDIHSYREAMNS